MLAALGRPNHYLVSWGMFVGRGENTEHRPNTKTVAMKNHRMYWV